MASLVKNCTRLITWSKPMCSPHSPLTFTAHQVSRPFSTSQTLYFKTIKRRKRYPFFWLQDKYRAYFDENLTSKNEEFFQEFLKDKYSTNGKSPLKTEPWDLDEKFDATTSRTGLLAKKLGVFPMWDKEGKRVLTTCLLVVDNHVIKYHSPEVYAKIGRPLNSKRYSGLGCLVVGAESTDPRSFTAEYNGLFEESGVMPKKKLTRFFVTHNARIEPGTPLFASHFRPGMYVDIYGKTTEQGLQGVRRRFRLKLGNASHGTTKAHNRIGSIGRGRKVCGPAKGKKMPGHMGGERVIMAGLKVWRVNTKYNLIYVQGPGLPGRAGDYLNVMDSRIFNKTPTVDNPPPFPTTSAEENASLEIDLHDSQLHKPTDPSIIFEVTEEERKAAALAARKFGKAKTAQKSS